MSLVDLGLVDTKQDANMKELLVHQQQLITSFQVDKKTGEKSKTRPRFVKQDQIAIVRFAADDVICMETFKDHPQLGRFTLRDEGKIHSALGGVTDPRCLHSALLNYLAVLGEIFNVFPSKCQAPFFLLSSGLLSYIFMQAQLFRVPGDVLCQLLHLRVII